MKLLTTFTPVENYILLNGQKARHKYMLKYAFMDLVIKKVLKTEAITKTPSRYDREHTYYYVSRGPEFSNYTPAVYERIFTNPFDIIEPFPILFGNMVKMSFQKSKDSFRYRKLVVENGQLKQYYNETILGILFNRGLLNARGKEAHEELKKEIDDTQQKIETLAATDQPKALELLKQLRGNIVLFDFTLPAALLVIEALYKQDLGSDTKPDGDYYGGGCSGCGSWGGFNDTSGGFDSGCGSSGCGGDGGGGGGCGGSGCSGCGGGGCGGCGS